MKRYDEEGPDSASWALHRKHIFVLSSAGKPIFSRFGDESLLAPLAGVLQALISFVSESGDTIRYVRAGAHRMVFLMRGPLYLAAMSRCGDSVPHLARQLSYLHAQILSILTAKVEAIFLKNAAFDLRGLLGGTDRVLRALIAAGSGDAAMLLGATPTLRTPPAAAPARRSSAPRGRRSSCSACCSPTASAQLLRPKGRCTPTRRPPPIPPAVFRLTFRSHGRCRAPDDPLVVNTVTSSAAFREDESWLPLCLPRFNPRLPLRARLIRRAGGLPRPPHRPGRRLPQLSACRQQLAAKLQREGELRSALLRAVGGPQCAAPRAGARRPRAARAPPARARRAARPARRLAAAGTLWTRRACPGPALRLPRRRSSRRRASRCTRRAVRTATARR